MTVLARIHQLVEQNCQFIIATHSPILMAYPDAEIYTLTRDGITKTPYERTEHYLVTRDFLNHPQRSIQRLLEE